MLETNAEGLNTRVSATDATDNMGNGNGRASVDCADDVTVGLGLGMSGTNASEAIMGCNAFGVAEVVAAAAVAPDTTLVFVAVDDGVGAKEIVDAAVECREWAAVELVGLRDREGGGGNRAAALVKGVDAATTGTADAAGVAGADGTTMLGPAPNDEIEDVLEIPAVVSGMLKSTSSLRSEAKSARSMASEKCGGGGRSDSGVLSIDISMDDNVNGAGGSPVPRVEEVVELDEVGE